MGLEKGPIWWEVPTVVTVKLDNKKRATIAQGKPGQVMAVTDNGDGSVTLTPVKPDVKKRPFDRHLYDDLRQEQIDLEAASAKVDVSAEERDRR
jgi:hypothetical protein